MTLAATTARLEAHWQREQRRRPPWDRWASRCPALQLDPDELRDRLSDRDRHRSGAVLAGLVALAAAGDDQAALLVTISLLPRMVQAESRHRRHDGSGDYEHLAGLLWEAVVTVTNPGIATLRESIERNVWRRKWRSERLSDMVPLNADQIARTASVGDHADDTVGRHHLCTMLDRLEAERRISPAARRVLQRMADGDDEQDCSAAARKQRWRTVVRLRDNPAALEALTA